MTPPWGEEPVATSGLNALLATAVRNSPDHVLVEDDRGPMTAAQFARRAACLAAHLSLGGLARGERVLIVAGAQAEAVVMLTAVLRAGLEPVLTACGVNPVELAAIARVCDAAALVGPSHYGGMDLGDVYLSAAAIAEGVRGILTQGPDVVDGAVDVSFAALDASPMPDETAASIVELPTIVTLAGPKLAPKLPFSRTRFRFWSGLASIRRDASFRCCRRPASPVWSAVRSPHSSVPLASSCTVRSRRSASSDTATRTRLPKMALSAPSICLRPRRSAGSSRTMPSPTISRA